MTGNLGHGLARFWTATSAPPRHICLSFTLGLNSFKGWEARGLVVHVASISKENERFAFYTALTRLKRSEVGRGPAALTIVCSSADLAEYGRAWGPEAFEDARSSITLS